MAYVATSDVKQYGGIPDSDSVDDAELTLIIARVSSFIDNYTGRTFECTSDNEATRYFTYKDDVEGQTLYLDKDLNTVASIVAGTYTIASSDYVTEPRTDKPFYGITLKAESPRVWTNSTSDGDYESAIQVNAQWAYSSTAPPDIQHACIRLTKWAFKQGRITDETADRPIVLESGATVLPTSIPHDVRDILEHYRRLEICS